MSENEEWLQVAGHVGLMAFINVWLTWPAIQRWRRDRRKAKALPRAWTVRP